jgi:hypothetical protein
MSNVFYVGGHVKPLILFIVGIWAASGAVYIAVFSTGAQGHVPALAFFAPALVLTAAAITFVLKGRRARRTGSTRRDSVEAQLVTRAQAGAMIDGLIAGCALGLWMLFARSTPAALAVFALVAAIVVDFWIRYGLLLRSLGRG